MQHVITLGLMTLHLGAKANVDDNLADIISKLQTMIAHDLNIPLIRVAELFEVVLGNLKHFDNIEEVREVVSQMRNAEA
jgi:hypothetical protein